MDSVHVSSCFLLCSNAANRLYWNECCSYDKCSNAHTYNRWFFLHTNNKSDILEGASVCRCSTIPSTRIRWSNTTRCRQSPPGRGEVCSKAVLILWHKHPRLRSGVFCCIKKAGFRRSFLYFLCLLSVLERCSINIKQLDERTSQRECKIIIRCRFGKPRKLKC